MKVTPGLHRYRIAFAAILFALLVASLSLPGHTPIAAAASCEVTYAVTNQWSNGFTADVTIRNSGAAISGWTLAWTFSGNQQITNAWNTSVTQSGAGISAGNVSSNANIVSGGTVSAGFQASFSGTNDPPASFMLNGVTCDSLGSPTSTPTRTPISTPTKTPTPTATAQVVTASVTPSATDVAVGDTIVVQATSNLGLERFTLNVIDISTGAVQDQANPIFTPARPDPISVSSGGVSWTLQAVRAGTVRFSMSVTGETFDPGNPTCGCSHSAFGGAMSAPVTVRAAPTPTSTPTNSCVVTIPSQWNSGFQAEVKISNTGTITTNRWTVTWRFSDNQTITNLWSGIYTQSGANVTVRNQSWNGRIEPGGSATFGFTATGSGSGGLTNITCTLTP